VSYPPLSPELVGLVERLADRSGEPLTPIRLPVAPPAASASFVAAIDDLAEQILARTASAIYRGL
jgi:hypothetical protein